jgi:hypothetical protein
MYLVYIRQTAMAENNFDPADAHESFRQALRKALPPSCDTNDFGAEAAVEGFNDQLELAAQAALMKLVPLYQIEESHIADLKRAAKKLYGGDIASKDAAFVIMEAVNYAISLHAMRQPGAPAPYCPLTICPYNPKGLAKP